MIKNIIIVKALIIITLTTIFLYSCTGKKIISSYTVNGSNELFAGIHHTIIFDFDNDKKESIFESRNIKVEHIDSNRYILTTDTIPSIDTLNIKQGKKRQELIFRIKPIPKLKVVIQTDSLQRNSLVYSANNFKTFRFIRTELVNFDYACRFKIIRYKITRISKDGNKTTISIAKPNSGPNRATYLAKKAKSGDIYLFEDIFVEIKSSNFYEIEYVKQYRKMDNVIVYIK